MNHHNTFTKDPITKVLTIKPPFIDILTIEALSVKVSSVRNIIVVIVIVSVSKFVPTSVFVHMTIPKEIIEHNDVKDFINLCHWDPSEGYDNVYIKVAQWMLNDGVVQGRFDEKSLISPTCLFWDPDDSRYDNIYIRVVQKKFDGNVVLGRIDVISLVLPVHLIWDPGAIDVSSDDGMLQGKKSLGGKDLSCPQILI